MIYAFNPLIILLNSTPADSEGFAGEVNFLIRDNDIDTPLPWITKNLVNIFPQIKNGQFVNKERS